MIFVESDFVAMMAFMYYLDHGLVPPESNKIEHAQYSTFFIQFVKPIDSLLINMSDSEKNIYKRKFRKMLKKAMHWRIKQIEERNTQIIKHTHKPENQHRMRRMEYKKRRDLRNFLNGIGYSSTMISYDLRKLDCSERSVILYRRKTLVMQFVVRQIQDT